MAEIGSLFKFLKEFNEISNPVITEIEHQTWSMRLADLPKIDEVWSIYHTKDFEKEKILEVTRPILDDCPEPDISFRDWVMDDFSDVDLDTVRIKEVLDQPSKKAQDQNENMTETFISDKIRVQRYEDWSHQRNIWRESQFEKKKAMEIYNRLFALYSDIKKEAESVELILGDGLIEWKTNEHSLNHPVFLLKVTLEFHPKNPSFVLKYDDYEFSLYHSMLRSISNLNHELLAPILEDLESSDFHMADVEAMTPYFEKLINAIDKEGRVFEGEEKEADYPIIYHDPILFLRKRNLGYSEFIEKAIADIEKNGDDEIADFFHIMLGNYESPQKTEPIREEWNQNGFDKDILLTLPANNEQLKIVKYLNDFGAVLVQGPPGTGKTHSIANLIGHLLSEGKSILVTSHSEKALAVLKEKVDKGLQSLCISLLSSASQRKEMDASLFDIAEKSTVMDLEEVAQRIQDLTEERNHLLDCCKAKGEELFQTRIVEHQDLVYGEERIKPSEAAKFIAEGKGLYDYLPGNTDDHTLKFPFNQEDLVWLYESNGVVSDGEEFSLSQDKPTLETVWSGEIFLERVEAIESLKSELKDWSCKIPRKVSLSVDEVFQITDRMISVIDDFNDMDFFEKKIVERTFKDSVYQSLWDDLLKRFEQVMQEYEKWRKIQFDHTIDYSEDLKEVNLLKVLDEITENEIEKPVSGLRAMFKKQWRQVKSGIRINNKPPVHKSEFEMVAFQLKYENRRRETFEKVKKLFKSVFQEDMITLDDFEEQFSARLDSLKRALRWKSESWKRMLTDVALYAEDEKNALNYLELDFHQPLQTISQVFNEVILTDISFELMNIELQTFEDEMTKYLNTLNQYSDSMKELQNLKQAVVEKNDHEYLKEYEYLENLYNKEDVMKARKVILQEIEHYNQSWAEAISNRTGIHGRSEMPPCIQEAWKYLQLKSQLTQLNAFDVNKTHAELKDLHSQIRENSKSLAYLKSWYNKLKSITPEQTQAIEGWRQTIKKIGKGTGKRAPMLMKKARELMPKCQNAIPVWIMPINKVVENFDPMENKFDVLIVDEASQANLLALPVLYLTKKMIVVGDDEQVSPSGIGVSIEKLTSLIQQYLTNVPNSHLFDERTSLYDMAKSSGCKPLMLTEHFRCLPEIIDFSNQLSYNGRIKPLRDNSGVKTFPAVVNEHIAHGQRGENKVNIQEAQHIASLICACIENSNYDGKTIGVISLLGDEQSKQIEKILHEKVSPDEFESRRIQCGTPPQFQGDERDIVFLSLVESSKKDGKKVILLSEDGRSDMYRKRYNVSVSRAKDQLWVVHSLNLEKDLRPEDIRYKLLQFASSSSTSSEPLSVTESQSPFEMELMNDLISEGYLVKPKWKVGTFTLDMVVEYGNRRMALACDGKKLGEDQLKEDIKRQEILERLGWKFLRVRASSYYQNPRECILELINQFEENGLKKGYVAQTDTCITKNPREDVISQVRARAIQFREVWGMMESN
jgi:very-short-patch-repair endonuclease/DNA polymerase III delta prime subunit